MAISMLAFTDMQEKLRLIRNDVLRIGQLLLEYSKRSSACMYPYLHERVQVVAHT